MTTIRKIAAVIFLILCGVTAALAQPSPGGTPSGYLQSWSFNDTNWLSDSAYWPVAFTNIANVSGGDGQCLSITATNAFLQYNVVESDGTTNLVVNTGTVTVWINPSWASTNIAGGTGPGTYARILEVGSFTTNASTEWWGLFVSPDGCNLSFSAEAGGVFTNYFTVPVSFVSNAWVNIAVTYSSTNTAIYTNGFLVTNGPGMTVYPGSTTLSNGFFVGSDSSASNQFNGRIDDLACYNIELDSNTVLATYDVFSIAYYGAPIIISDLTNAPSAPTNSPVLDVITGPGILQFVTNVSSCITSSNFWITNVTASPGSNQSVNVTFTIEGGSDNTFYDVFGTAVLTSPLTNGTWVWLGQGQHCKTYTMNIQTNETAFFVLGGPTDTDGDGLTDAYELLVSHTDPNSPDSMGQGMSDGWQIEYFGQLGVDPNGDPEGDGWSNLEKYLLGMNPNQFYTPPPPQNVVAQVDNTGANVVLTWATGGGPVDHYGIELADPDIDLTNEVGTVNSATFTFTDDIGLDSTSESITGAPYYFIRAYFGNGTFANSLLVSIYKPAFNPDIRLIPGPMGNAYLAINAPPAGLSQIVLYYEDFNTFTAQTIALIDATNLVNGIVAVPTNQLNGYPLENGLSCTLLGPNGTFGAPVTLQPTIPEEEAGNFISPFQFGFMDTRPHVKENLRFLLRSATISRPFSFASNESFDGQLWQDPDAANMQNPEEWFARPPTSTNYEYYGSRTYIPAYDYSELMPLRVIQDNYLWYNFTLSGDFDQNGGASAWFSPYFQVRVIYDPAYQYTGNGTESPLPMPLTSTNDTWLAWDDGTELFPLSDFADAADAGVFQTTNGLAVGSGVRNCFELALVSLAAGATNQIYTPGAAYSSNYWIFDNFDSPILPINDYYFASQTAYFHGLGPRPPMPGTPDFSVNNPSPLMVTTVGQPITVAGWAKEPILNNYPLVKYAYLEQFFDKAYTMGTNGVATTNQTGLLSPYGEFFPVETGPVALVTMPDIDSGACGTSVVQVISLSVDANHDGTMDFTSYGPDMVTASKPYRFWVNDNQDSGDDGGNGIPGPKTPKPDALDNVVNGTRDLVDFFPVYLNIQSLLQAMGPDSGAAIWLLQADSALNYIDPSSYAGFSNLTATNCLAYLTDTNIALALGNASTFQINNSGTILSSDFVAGLRDQGKGMLLIEARTNTIQPLTLQVRVGTNVIAQTQLPLSISPVEQMFRQKNMLCHLPAGDVTLPDRLADSSVPNEPDTNGKNFVFVHGYNVSTNQARGWAADFYKRMYWSGSHAKFYNVTWEADDSQVPIIDVTIDLQTNIVNAFLTVSNFATFIGTLTNDTVVAAHSLGNMLVLGSLNDCTNINFNIDKFFMIDAAVAIEAVQGNATPDTNMYYPDWIPYDQKLYASHWWQLFPSSDARSTLTWSNRLANFGSTEVYNFYSSGEEVLREYTNGTPPSELLGSLNQVEFFIFGTQLNRGLPAGAFTWAWEEMLKGRGELDGVLSSSHGGWQFNSSYGSISPSQAAALTSSQLVTNPFFGLTGQIFFSDTNLLTSTGSAYAKANRNRILSDAIPALTLPIGANPVTALDEPGNPHNFNMSTNSFENSWPALRLLNTTEQNNWHHSDCRQVAYTFTHRLFDNFVTIGELK